MASDPGELDLGTAEVARLVREHHGCDPLAVTRLESELSTVARIDLASGVVVAKVTRYSPDELLAARWRLAAMQHLHRAGIPVGGAMPDRNGELVTVATAGSETVLLQLSEWLAGVPLESITPAPDLLRSVGDTAARIARALAGWGAPPVEVTHPWELVRTLATIDEAIDRVADQATRALVAEAAERFRRTVEPVLTRLPRSVVHHDLHDSNVLVEPALGRVSGVLDFGDMVVGPRVAELAVAAAYASRNAADPVAAFLLVAEGWGTTVRLSDDEIGVIYRAGIGRLAVNAAVWAAREHTSRGAYARARSARSRAALVALLGADEEAVQSALRARLT